MLLLRAARFGSCFLHVMAVLHGHQWSGPHHVLTQLPCTPPLFPCHSPESGATQKLRQYYMRNFVDYHRANQFEQHDQIIVEQFSHHCVTLRIVSITCDSLRLRTPAFMHSFILSFIQLGGRMSRILRCLFLLSSALFGTRSREA